MEDHRVLLSRKIVLCHHIGRINSHLVGEKVSKRPSNVVDLWDRITVPTRDLSQTGVSLKILSRSYHKYNNQVVASAQVSMHLQLRSAVNRPLAIELVDLWAEVHSPASPRACQAV
jgi:hypothetical protein